MTTLISATQRKFHPHAAHGAKAVPPYAITIRNGATPHMVLETQAMLRYAQRMAFQGKFDIEDRRFAERQHTHDVLDTDVETCVQIWDAVVWCNFDGKMVTINLNTVNEYTTAQDILDFCKLWCVWQFLVESNTAEDALVGLIGMGDSGDASTLDELLLILAPEVWVEDQLSPAKDVPS